MPIYVYRCDDCRDTEEVLQKASDGPLEVCPKCGSHAMRKLISNVGIIFKGSGFYKTDNASNSVGTREGSHHSHHEDTANSGATESSTSAETKSASTPATGENKATVKSDNTGSSAVSPGKSKVA